MNPNKPRVCLLTESYYPVVGGGEVHARLLCREFKRLGVPVFVLTRRRAKSTPAFERVDDVPVLRVAPAGVPKMGKYLMLVPTFLRLVRERRDYDVIYVCGLRTLGLIAVWAARLLGKRCVLRSESKGEFSGGFIWQRMDGSSRPALKLLFGGAIRTRNYFLKKADRFLSISSVIREEFEACGISLARIAEIPNGIDTNTFAPADPDTREALRRRLNLPQGRLFMYSGKLNRGKGLEFLLRVWKVWGRDRPDCFLVLVGSGAMQFLSCEDELREYVREQHLETSVRFVGAVSNVRDYLQAADAFVFPSESEALPLALLEALATGLPAIASDIGGVRDIVTDGRSGRLAPPNDAAAWIGCLNDLVDHPGVAAEWGAQGRRTVATSFSIAHVAEEHLRLFRAVCGTPGGTGL